MANRLLNESSLYLRQHADNPVDWYPWGPEALAAAQAAGKPMLVSIGYSACHWCHVMAHECFEDDYIAGLMNRHFICVKVDREERPDIDQIYMEAVQMITGRGGWPLNVFCFPDGRPFFGGTYFPPEDRGHGIVPWPQLLMRVADYFRRKPEELEENAENILKNMALANQPKSEQGKVLGREDLVPAAVAICSTHDDEWGGFGDAPKFPPSMTLDFLLAIRGSRACEQTPGLTERIDTVVRGTLKGMALGGLFDQIGGGFARYSVDRMWLIPHFEKMLYDNGLLLDIYSKAWLRYRDPLFAAVTAETVDWLEREMRGDNGLWAAAIDADSEGEEGKFYVWTPEEITAVLGDEAAKSFCAAYSISTKGNFEHGRSNPACAFDDIAVRDRLAPERAKLRQARDQRIAPGKDSKQPLAWNALAIRGLIRAAFAFGRRDWLQRAHTNADWVWHNMVESTGSGPRLKAIHYPGKGNACMACLDDYAFFAEAMLALAAVVDWLEPGLAITCINRAEALADSIFAHFADSQAAGFYFTADDHEALVSRKKTWFDNATPAGNSSLLHTFAGLYALTAKSRYLEALDAMRPAYPGLLQRSPAATAHALSAYTAEATGIAVVKCGQDTDIEALRNAICGRPWRPFFILGGDPNIAANHFQLCVGSQCLEPVVDPLTLAELL